MPQPEDVSMALFCDFENVALGVRDAQYEKLDIKPILERLLLKGTIVVKKAYCDWERYKSFKAVMHEANFELIEIPHVRQSGKNSADIRLVVDALDLCYTKAHVNTFVIISGDSDFSPLVSKLRENAKRVIGIGVKQSTSDLLIANCDEFIYYDDLVREREAKRGGGRRDARDAQAKRSSGEEKARREEIDARRSKGIGMAVATLEDLLEDRADDERVWASVLKEALKRRNPGFNESYFGFKTFGAMLEEAQKLDLLEFGRDEKSGAWVKRRAGASGAALADVAAEVPVEASVAVAPAPTFATAAVAEPEAVPAAAAAAAEAAPAAAAPRRRSRGKQAEAAPRSRRRGAAAQGPAASATEPPVVAAVAVAEPAAVPAAESVAKPKAARQPRASRPRKTKAAAE